MNLYSVTVTLERKRYARTQEFNRYYVIADSEEDAIAKVIADAKEMTGKDIRGQYISARICTSGVAFAGRL